MPHNFNRSSLPREQQQQTFEIITHAGDESILNAISIVDCFIIILGTVGNLISFYLLTRKRLRSVSSMRYLAALTLVDTICLYGWYLSSVYRQLSGEQLRRIENISSFLCKFISYISFSSLQTSSILLCILTIDRLLIIVSTQWRSNYANSIFANRIIGILIIFVLLLNIIIPIRLGNKGVVQYKLLNVNENLYDANNPENHQIHSPHEIENNIVFDEEHNQQQQQPILTQSTLYRLPTTTVPPPPPSDADDDDDDDDTLLEKIGRSKRKNITMQHCYDDGDKVLRAWNKLHLCIYSLIPFPILCLLNLIVIQKTRVAAKSAVDMNSSINNMKKFKNGQQFVTRLLLFLTLSFLFTTLPSTVVYAFWHHQVLKIQYGRILLNLLNTLQFSRHSLNWIIYMYSSSYMREEFKKCVACADSEYELAEAALAERPSLAIEILRQLELQNNLNTDNQDYYLYLHSHTNNESSNYANNNNSKSVSFHQNHHHQIQNNRLNVINNNNTNNVNSKKLSAATLTAAAANRMNNDEQQKNQIESNEETNSTLKATPPAPPVSKENE